MVQENHLNTLYSLHLTFYKQIFRINPEPHITTFLKQKEVLLGSVLNFQFTTLSTHLTRKYTRNFNSLIKLPNR